MDGGTPSGGWDGKAKTLAGYPTTRICWGVKYEDMDGPPADVQPVNVGLALYKVSDEGVRSSHFFQS